MSREALEGSIKKWTRIVKSTKGIDKGTKNCPLCKQYYDVNCVGCPIAKKTSRPDCSGTPYWEWMDHLQEDHDEYNMGSSRKPYCKECLRITKKELLFLESLREIYKEV
jgi:hypothetical protein